MKPKKNYKGDKYVAQGIDGCQTPPYALVPLLPHLQQFDTVWESACGEKLFLLAALLDGGIGEVIGTDIVKTGHNFFDYQPENWEVQVTNPPYGIKYPWLRHSYELGKPFALLLPVETIGAKTAQIMFEEYGIEVIFMRPRVDFYMPFKGWDSHAQFPVAWFTWKLNIGQQMTFADITKEKKEHAENICVQ